MDDQPNRAANIWRSPITWALFFALVKLVLHFSFNGGYGYFRDELYYIACGEHLAWGYPDHAPLVALAAKLTRLLFSDSLFALRLFPAVAGAAKVFLAGLLVVEFGGRRFAVVLACLSVIVAPAYLAFDNLFSMNAFEPVFWMLCVYFAVLSVKRGDSRFWFWFGVFAGIALMNKHSTLIFGLAIVVGLLLTKERRAFLNKWIWMGGAAAFVIFLPNLIWQIQNDWATIELLSNVQKTGKNVALAPHEFIGQQIFMLLPLTAPVLVAGIYFFLFDRNGRRFRFLGIAYLVALALMILLKAKSYYLLPIYPYLFAGGACLIERLTAKNFALRVARAAYVGVLVIFGSIFLPMALPVLSIENFLRYQETLGLAPPKTEVSHEGVLPQHYGDQFGWQEMTEKVAGIYHALPPEERARAAILADNYGEAGAIDFFGASFGLPKSVSPHQSYYLWGPRDYTGEVLIILGEERKDWEGHCQKVEEAAETNHPYSMSDEKYKILVCRGLSEPLSEMWHKLKRWN